MSDLYEEIVESQSQKTEVFENIADAQSILVFSVGTDNYSIASANVKEILRSVEIFPMPFVPHYVKGVLNYYSKPYAVVDTAEFLGETKTIESGNIFLVLNDSNGIVLRVSDIREFQAEEGVQEFSTAANANFFKGAITFEGEAAPILNIENIAAKIKLDVEKN